MGAGLTAGGSSRRVKGNRRRRSAKDRLMSEINVTPMVDVMLVLLIIFMVAAPMMTSGMQVDLPKTRAQSLPTDDKPLVVSIDENGAVFLNKTELESGELIPKLEAISGAKKGETRIFIRADQRNRYGEVMAVIGSIYSAGFTKVGLETDPAAQ